MTESTAITTIIQAKEELIPMKSEFSAVLPSHISSEKFSQVCITALENNPQLLSADRQSFKVACLNAANDGLLPDKREGAFVVFNTTVERPTGRGHSVEKISVPMVQWMPMIGGVLKKAYQSGKVQSIQVEIVRKNDVYRRAAGDNAEIVHEPLDFSDRGAPVGGYCIIRFKDGGEPYREVMSLDQIEKVRAVSRAKNSGPWVAFWEEMAKKTILRRALKRVPLSAEVDQVLSRDDMFYNLETERQPLLEAPRPAIPKVALFADKAHVRAKPAIAAQEGPQERKDDAAPTQEPARDTEAARIVLLLSGADDLASLLDLTHEASDLELDADDHAWVQKAIEETRARLMPSVDEILEGDHVPDFGPTQDTDPASQEPSSEAGLMKGGAEEHPAPPDDFPGDRPAFVLRAVPSSVSGLKVYQNPRLWVGDLLQKLSATSGPALTAFWQKNVAYILEARDNGHTADAERVIAAAAAKGLKTEGVIQ